MSSEPRPTAAQVLPWVSLVARVILGAVFIVAGVLKLTDLAQSVIAVRAYQFPISPALESLIGHALPIVEVLLGLVILAGLATRWSGLLGGLMQIAYIGVIISAWARGLAIDCGCLTPGGVLNLDAGQKTAYALDILRDVGLLACAVWLVIFPASRFSLDAWLKVPTNEEP